MIRVENPLRIIYGTMTFGKQATEEEASDMVQRFLKFGGREMDTAYVYSDGESEEILGRILKSFDRKTYLIASKAKPIVYGNFRPQSIRK